jgi:hypothetical protein
MESFRCRLFHRGNVSEHFRIHGLQPHVRLALEFLQLRSLGCGQALGKLLPNQHQPPLIRRRPLLPLHGLPEGLKRELFYPNLALVSRELQLVCQRVRYGNR